jgi:hypothetical protein
MQRPARSLALFAVLAVSIGVFWRTAYPTITWWDSPNYSLAAHTFGLTSAPGGLLLTILGWPVSHLPLGMSPARNLNLFAGLLAGITAALVFIVALRLRAVSGPANEATGVATFAGAAVGALTFAFSATLWEHAIKFTPYVLTAVFTGLILWAMLRWWESAHDPRSWLWLLLIGLLFGLDFSVHRTNALLIPSAIAWVAIRSPQSLLRLRSVAATGAGLAGGLAVHLIVIPIARYTSSPVNVGEPSSLARFWSYVSLESAGGNFLVDLWPRNSPFWSVQVTDLVRIFGDNFFHWNTSASLPGVLPALAMIAGFVVLYRRSRSLATAWMVSLFLLAATTVVYFNIPANFFRPFDRHYLPIFVVAGATIAFGMSWAAESLVAATQRARAALLVGASAMALLPVVQLVGNWTAHDASKRHFAEDFARNALESLPRNAIYITVGDNDTFPAMYMQGAEGVRPDVRIVNIGWSTVDWYITQQHRRDSTPLVSFSAGERLMRSRGLLDTLLSVPIAGTSDSVRLRVKPSTNGMFYPNELALMDIISTNRWRRPIALAITSGSFGEWLSPNARLDGLHWHVDANVQTNDDSTVLRDNLLSKFAYRGYADASVRLEPEARGMGFQYFNAFRRLLEKERASGRTDECRAALVRFQTAFPSDRLRFDEHGADLGGSCG